MHPWHNIVLVRALEQFLKCFKVTPIAAVSPGCICISYCPQQCVIPALCWCLPRLNRVWQQVMMSVGMCGYRSLNKHLLNACRLLPQDSDIFWVQICCLVTQKATNAYWHIDISLL